MNQSRSRHHIASEIEPDERLLGFPQRIELAFNKQCRTRRRQIEWDERIDVLCACG
ncbi:hypothetical protein [Mesorhizobium sp. M1216]|uniref:hypothetical protein n=1 Tax=Mesorhizobium sp. M1216 TaxID=2957069 RepID=UPI0033396E31